MIKKYKWVAIGGLLAVLAVGYVVCDRPSLMDKVNYWRGQYEEMKKVAAATEIIRLATISELTGANALLQGSLDSAYTIIAKKEAEKEAAETALKKAHQGWDAFSVEAQAKLHELDSAWSAKFDIVQAQSNEKDKVIFSLTKQYQNALSIGVEYKGLWNQEKTLRLQAETGLNLQDKRIRSLQRKAKLIPLCAVAVVLAVCILKK